MEKEKGGTRAHPAFLTVLVLLVIVLAGTLLIRQSGVTISVGGTTPLQSEQQLATDSKELYYSTMHPWIVQDHPGTCPICGMELVQMPADMQADWERNNQVS